MLIQDNFCSKLLVPLWLTLIWVVSNPPHYWFNINNTEAVKAVTLFAFGSFQLYFNRHICAKFGILNLPQSPDIWQNSEGSIFDFPIFDLWLIKENCRDSRTTEVKLT